MKDQFLSQKIVFLAVVVSVCACLQVFPEAFIYLRKDLLTEFWRLWTAHWVHVSWIHYFLNMLAFICLPFIFPHLKNRYAILLLVLLPPLIHVHRYGISVLYYWCFHL